MRSFAVLFAKELQDARRNYKWLWLPVAFAFFGALQPVALYYMPQILEAVGGLPEGAVLDIPLPDGGGMMAEVLAQFGTVGVLVVVLANMGAVAAEKQARTAALVLVRPVSRPAWILAKWASGALLAVGSLAAGVLAGWYYTRVLIGPVPADRLLAGTAAFALWLVFAVTLVLLMSTVLNSAAAAVVSLLALLGLSVIGSLGSAAWLGWLPSRLPGLAAMVLATGEASGHPARALIGAVLAIALLLVAAGWRFRRQDIAD